ncbi:non-specific lipid transfer protein GPI-anchored 1 [Typha latifolia]|uniref:non-specific lipid transfer protein GPI-anchored 1 n=1 Tax=Typha latifolia TaxID=4733 RepID=UPI003C2F0A21
MLSLNNNNTSPFLFCLVLLSCLLGYALCDNSIQDKCSQEFTKLTNCLDYASAKADTPTSDCCSSVSSIRKADPVCLCYIIQQSYSGASSSLKNLGLHFDRLLALPGACKLANSSVADCPKLLNISPGSPDYGIFTNATSKGASPTTSTPTTASSTSKGIMLHISIHATIAIALISAIFSSIF